MVQTEIGYLFFHGHLAKQPIHIRHHRISLPFAIHQAHHIARADKEDICVGSAFAQEVNLIPIALHESANGFGFLIGWNGIPAELQDDESYIL